MKSLLVALIAAVVLFLIAGLVRTQVWFNTPLESLQAERVYEVKEGASLNGVAAELGGLGVLEWPRVFAIRGRLSGQAEQIKAGEYLLEPGLSPADLLAKMVAGTVRLYPITIVEGWTTQEMLAVLAASEVVDSTLGAAPDADALSMLPDAIEAGHPEGIYYPDTYMVARGMQDIALLRQATDLMRVKLDAAWESRAPDLPISSPYELLTLASIIERETAVDSERTQVAGVFVRRLQKGMRLQTDPTVIYGLGDKFDGNLTRAHLLTDNPYNTYTRGGLPPTPIALPGEASLQAAANPAEGDTLYFVASGEADGTHVFSATLEEHNAAVAAYISKLRQVRRNQDN